MIIFGETNFVQVRKSMKSTKLVALEKGTLWQYTVIQLVILFLEIKYQFKVGSLLKKQTIIGFPCCYEM